MTRLRTIVPASLFALLLSLAIAGPLPAQGAMRATIFVLADPPPESISSLQQLQRFARAHKVARLQERTDLPIERRRWEATLVVQFSRPMSEFDFQILYFDVTGGGEPRLVGGPEDVRVSSRNETTFVNDIRMPRPRFAPNRDIEIVVNVRRQEAGRQRVHIVGQPVQHSGEVDFTREGQ